MNARIFNLCIALGWLLVVAGACLVSVSAGLIVGGVLMLVITILLARFAGVSRGDG